MKRRTAFNSHVEFCHVMTLARCWIAFLFAPLLFTGCDDFLVRTPPSQASTEDFYREGADMDAAVVGIYGTLRSTGLYGRFWTYGDLRSDISDLTFPGGFDPTTNIDEFSVSASNRLLNETWIDHYQGISRTNTVLDRLDDASIDESAAAQYEGEARFLRGLMYFNLVRIFGGVPLVLSEVNSVDDIQSERESVDGIYSQIINDLEIAAQQLPASYQGDDQGRATSGAANALLGKVYLTRNEYESAIGALEAVIASSQYDLLDEYSEIFDFNNPLHAEAIFTVRYQANGLGHGSSYSDEFAPRGYPGVAGGQTRNRPTPTLLDAYTPEDEERFSATVDTQFVDEDGSVVSQRYTKKYLSPNPFPGEGHEDWPVLRYADVLLMYAEALNEAGRTAEAYGPLNRVRDRAGLDPLSGLDQASFRDAVYRERMIELAFEGHRWFDLVRTGRAIEAMANATPSYSIQEYQLVFPVPQAQIDVTGGALEQNPGY